MPEGTQPQLFPVAESSVPRGQSRSGPQGVLVLGAPGTGRSTEVMRRAVERAQQEGRADRILLLAPTRLSADRLRNAFSQSVGATVSTPPARAWHSYAFDLLRRAHAEHLLEGVRFEPRLLAGPEQDVLIGEMLQEHAAGGGRPPAWPEDLHQALGTRGVRREIREFLDRCAEYNLSTARVRELGESLGRPEWVAASDFREEYEALRRLRMPQAYDPSALVHEAAQFLEGHPEFLAQERQRIGMVLVEDLQEATPAVLRLLTVLGSAGPGTAPDLVLSVCTDITVQGFRGARPEALRGLRERLEAYTDWDIVSLEVQRRSVPEIAAAVGRISERIPPVAGFRHLPAPTRVPESPAAPASPAVPTSPDLPSSPGPEEHNGAAAAGSVAARPAVTVETVASSQQELRLISQHLLEEHVRGGRPLDQMAVVVRSSSQLASLQRHLAAEGIPAVVPAAETPLREEPAVRPFLDALWLAAAGASASLHRIQPLLTSRLGGASPSTLRRLRQTLRAQELRTGGRRSGDELLLAALVPGAENNPAPGAEEQAQEAPVPDGPGTAPLRRVRRVLDAAREHLGQSSATADQALWSLWEASGLARTWEEESRGAGPAAERAHRDLDAMVALFKTAERYVDQQPGAGPLEFLEYLDSQDLPMDTLAPRAAGREAVVLGTPASVAGREWPWVLVAGVQQEIWPNTTVRGGLLRTQELVDVVCLGAEQARSVTFRDRVRETRWDELRTFAMACSRASERLVLTAAQNEEDVPSEFLDLVDPLGPEEAPRRPQPVRRPMTLRGLVAELRRHAQDTSDPQTAAQAAQQLAVLAEGNGDPVPGADPSTWWGLLPLSDASAAVPAEGPVRLSPSRLETIERSPLDWFVAASGGEPGTDRARSLGTLVHEIAQEHPVVPEGQSTEEFRDTLLEAFDQKSAALGLPSGWEGEALREQAVQMLTKYAAYAKKTTLGTSRTLRGVEQDFRVLVRGGAREVLLAGRVDRLEADLEGRYVIIDLKTGKRPPAKDEIPEHPQLTAYQVALAAGAGRAMEEESSDPEAPRPEPLLLPEGSVQELPGGAALVHLGTSHRSFHEQAQPGLGEQPEWAVQLVRRCAELISTPRIQARHAEGRKHPCALPSLCPLCSAGRQVTQP